MQQHNRSMKLSNQFDCERLTSHLIGQSRKRTTAVTGPPQKNVDFKTRVIGGSR
jgi:hypothetical protein